MKRNNYSNLSEAFDDAFETVYYYGLEWILEEGVEPKTDAEMDALEADVNARSRRGELVYTNDWSAEFKRYIGDDRARGRGSVALKYISERMGITRRQSAILAYARRRYQMGLEEEAESERGGEGVSGGAMGRGSDGGVSEGAGVREGAGEDFGEGVGIDSSKSFRLSDLCRMETQVDCVYKGTMTYDSDDGYEGCYDDSSAEARQRALKYAGDLEALVKRGFIRKGEGAGNCGAECSASFSANGFAQCSGNAFDGCSGNAFDGCSGTASEGCSANALRALSKENEAIGGREFLYQMEDSVAGGIESDADFAAADTRSDGAGLSEGEAAKAEGGGEMREGGEAEACAGACAGARAVADDRAGAEDCAGVCAGACARARTVADDHAGACAGAGSCVGDEDDSVEEGTVEIIDYPIGLYVLLRQDTKDIAS